MTAPTPAHLRALWDQAGDAAAGKPGAPWDEGLEARIDQVVDSIDEETGRHRPLLPRRDR